jgi:hypothetical protein
MKKTLEFRIRIVTAVAVAALGLFASTPSVHGLANTRGAIACNINNTLTPRCTSKLGQTCTVTYTKCQSLQGPKDRTCSMASVSSCKSDPTSCQIMTDYDVSYDCAATAYAPTVGGSSSTGTASRRSRLQ